MASQASRNDPTPLQFLRYSTRIPTTTKSPLETATPNEGSFNRQPASSYQQTINAPAVVWIQYQRALQDGSQLHRRLFEEVEQRAFTHGADQVQSLFVADQLAPWTKSLHHTLTRCHQESDSKANIVAEEISRGDGTQAAFRPATKARTQGSQIATYRMRVLAKMTHCLEMLSLPLGDTLTDRSHACRCSCADRALCSLRN